MLEKHEKQVKIDSSLFLKDRGILRFLLQSGEIEEARNLLIKSYKEFYELNYKVKAYLDFLDFINLIVDKDLENAIEYA